MSSQTSRGKSSPPSEAEVPWALDAPRASHLTWVIPMFSVALFGALAAGMAYLPGETGTASPAVISTGGLAKAAEQALAGAETGKGPRVALVAQELPEQQPGAPEPLIASAPVVEITAEPPQAREVQAAKPALVKIPEVEEKNTPIAQTDVAAARERSKEVLARIEQLRRERTQPEEKSPLVCTKGSCPEGFEDFGTAVHFAPSVEEAAKAAKGQEKLVFVMHLSGNFADEKFT